MVDDRLSFVLRPFGVESSRPTALRKVLAAAATAEEPDVVMAIDLPDHEIPLAGLTKEVAFGIHTG
jgi:hypothetical protein